jgi:hypothetical protein
MSATEQQKQGRTNIEDIDSTLGDIESNPEKLRDLGLTPTA